MAYIVPSDISQVALASGHNQELVTLAQLKSRLSGAYTVFHSVHWTREYTGHTAFGEIDFVVINRDGDVLFIEQKDGPLEETASGLFKNYWDGPKDVVKQIHRSIDKVREKFKWQHGKQTSFKVDYLIYCPDYRVKDLNAAGLDQSRIVDAAAAGELSALGALDRRLNVPGVQRVFVGAGPVPRRPRIPGLRQVVGDGVQRRVEGGQRVGDHLAEFLHVVVAE